MSDPAPSRVSFGSPVARALLVATTLASGMAFLDATVVNVALPQIRAELGGDLVLMQWVVDGYLLTLGSLVLIGGSLGDVFGRTGVFAWGVLGFTVCSVLCGLAPSAPALIAARCLQGGAAAAMVPGSLALISSLFVREERGRAIGLWSGLSGIAIIVGPLIGGGLVDAMAGGWRLAFAINVPLGLIVLVLVRSIPPLPGTRADRGPTVDLLGGVLTVSGLALIVTALIETRRVSGLATILLVAAGVVLLCAFWWVETVRERTRRPPPMMPPTLWRISSFRVANVVTFAIYSALGAFQFLTAVTLQVALGWSALAAGAATAPVMVLLAVLSSRVGRLLPRIGARPLLTCGALLMALGLALLALLPLDGGFLRDVLPGMVVMGVGLSCLVTPITATALEDIPTTLSGVGSGANNAVARVAGLIAIAVVPLAASFVIGPESTPLEVLDGYRRGMLICAAFCLSGALVSHVAFTRDTGRIRA